MDEIHVVPYDPAWPAQYQAEVARLVGAVGPLLTELEHIGSTAVPGLAAKPILDIMAAVPDIEDTGELVARLAELGYLLTDAGMRQRLFLRRAGPPAVHLHVVGHDTWSQRKERLMRDRLAPQYRHDGPGSPAPRPRSSRRSWTARGPSAACRP